MTASLQSGQIVQQSNLAKLVESNVRFTGANIPGQETLLCLVYVQRQPNIPGSAEQIRADLTQLIQTRLLQQGFNVTPLVEVTVLETPALN
ncbi:hypothetical protein NDI52_33605 [Leptolyngbya sp. PL-A3]|uniref:hypothetical protein n=1 Tax=Leptolyngbya sp. PL-A3 TaxID=2933911 RepID=UPI0032993EFF